MMNEDHDFDTVECPTCKKEQPSDMIELGILGDNIWYECRFCGSQWSERNE